MRQWCVRRSTRLLLCAGAPRRSRARGQSLSLTLADLIARGVSQLDEPVELRVDERSGFPVLSVARRITSDDVAAALDEGRVPDAVRSAV